MNRTLQVLSTLLILLISSATYGQVKTVKGTVFDESDFNLPGANVIVKGTTTGATTDFNGVFKIKAKKGDVLIISFMGYKNKEVTVNDATKYTVKLDPDAAVLGDVVVTGFQTISKDRAAGAFESLSDQVLDVKPTSSVSNLIQGQMAGVDVNSNGKISIRGVSSFKNHSPLIVVDGFPIEGGIESINPNNIASVNVLKDASASSIWGARSANGVIVVTTKSGGSDDGKMTVSFNSFVRVGEKVDLDYANPIADAKTQIGIEQYFAHEYNIASPTGIEKPTALTPTNTNVLRTEGLYLAAMNEIGYIDNDLVSQRLNELSNYNYRSNVEDELMRNPVYQQYNLAIRGNSKKNNYSFSILYDQDKTNFIGTKSDRMIIDFKDAYKYNDYITFTASVYTQYKQRKSDGSNMGEVKGLAAYDRILDENNNYVNQSTGINYGMRGVMNTMGFPYDWNYNVLQEQRNRDLANNYLQNRLQFGVDIKIIEGLKFSSKFQYERVKQDAKNFYSDKTYNVRNTINTAVKQENGVISDVYYPKGGIIKNQNYITNDAFNFRNQLSWNHYFGEKHNVNIIAGTEIIQNKRDETYLPDVFGASAVKLTTAILPDTKRYLNYSYNGSMGTSLNHKRDVSYNYTMRRYFSLYTNASYTYDSKYTITGSVRTDASNIVSSDPKYRYTPLWSVGGNWNIGSEDFMENVEAVNRLNLRASYGINAMASTLSSNVTTISYSPGYIGNEYTNHVGGLTHGNPNLSWEKTKTFNTGVDFSLWNSKLYGSVDVYRKEGINLYYNRIYPSTLGFSRMEVNYAGILNKGIEIQVGTKWNLADNISLESNLNYSYNNNKIEEIDDTGILVSRLRGRGAYIKGGRVGDYWAYDYAGYNENGVPEVVGTDGVHHSMIAATPLKPNEEVKMLRNVGTTIAPHIAGWTNTFNIYDFSVTTVITGKFGHVFENTAKPFTSAGIVSLTNYNKDLPNYLDNPEARDFPGSINNTNINQLQQRRNYTNYLSSYVDDASFIRFNDLIVNYSFNRILKEHGLSKHVKGLNLYFNITNVGLLWTANKWDMDPEYPLGRIKPQRSYTIGARINL